jgi:hypothetical protein
MKTLTIIPQFANGNIYKNYSDKDTIRPSYCYLHGELENLVGYDIFYILKDDLSEKEINEDWLSDEFEPGIYPAIFEDKECTFFYWKCELNRPHGLVVLNSDTTGYEDALKKYTMKKKSI